jgi:Asp-tRNA(Asn)/Glu-tRNA(Gln) amidotransferase A subunit family amidase
MKDAYDLQSIRMPYLKGVVLKLVVSLVEGPLGGLLAPGLLENAGITGLRKRHFDEAPTFSPIHYTGGMQTQASAVPEAQWPADHTVENPVPGTPGPGSSFSFPGIHDYAKAYRDGSTTPEEVARRFLAALDQADSGSRPLKAFIAVDKSEVLRQARESTLRFKAGKPLGLFDGVPVAVKDELDMVPYPTTVGTAFLGKEAAKVDATVVARLRAAGAMLVGKTNMHEIGINVTGLNPHHGTTRNPYNPDHFTGGSSSGSATAVASGLVPLAVGADGGGSIRIPAAFCGITGLKATYGRVSESGAAPLDWSVAHIGPLAASATDTALGYALMAGPDPKDPISLHQSLPVLDGWDDMDLRGLKLGVYWPWFRHAEAEVVGACEALLKGFEKLGGRIVEVSIPDLEANRVAHSITILSEMAQAMEATRAEHNSGHGLDVRLNLALARRLSATDYVMAQRVRTRMINHFADVFRLADVVLTPSSGLAAPLIRQGALPDGESDLSTTIEIMRFATVANMTGLPAISFPAGYTGKGLPIGMQAMGRPWEEHTLLRLARVAETMTQRRKPEVFFNLLQG